MGGGDPGVHTEIPRLAALAGPFLLADGAATGVQRIFPDRGGVFSAGLGWRFHRRKTVQNRSRLVWRFDRRVRDFRHLAHPQETNSSVDGRWEIVARRRADILL